MQQHDRIAIAAAAAFKFDPVDGQPFARGVSNQALTVPRLGEAMVKVEAVSDLSSVIGQIHSIPRLAMYGFKYRLVGRFFSGEQRYPFDYRGKISADQPE